MNRYFIGSLILCFAGLSVAFAELESFDSQETFVQPVILSDFAEEFNTLLAESSKKQGGVTRVHNINFQQGHAPKTPTQYVPVTNIHQTPVASAPIANYPVTSYPYAPVHYTVPGPDNNVHHIVETSSVHSSEGEHVYMG